MIRLVPAPAGPPPRLVVKHSRFRILPEGEHHPNLAWRISALRCPSDPDFSGDFDREWAQALVTEVLRQLELEYQSKGKALLHEKLLPFLTRRPAAGDHATLAKELRMNEAPVRMALHRMRNRFGELLRAEVSATVEPGQVNRERDYLASLWVGQMPGAGIPDRARPKEG